MALELLGNLLLLVIIAGLALAGVLIIQIWKKGLSTKVSYLRLYIQLISVVAIFYIYSVTKFYLYVLLAIFLATIFLGRFFCGWICPFGFYMDLVTAIRKALKTPYKLLPQKLNNTLNRLRYAILGVIVVLPFVIGGSQFNSWVWLQILRGSYRFWMILLAPLEPIIVPWESSLSLGGLNFGFPYVSDIIHYGTGSYASDIGVVVNSGTVASLSWELLLAVVSFVVVMLAASFLVRRFWCRFCPSGASAGCLNSVGLNAVPLMYIEKDEEKCPKCGICLRVCPVQVSEVYEQKGGKIKTSMCLNCFRCVEMCPYQDTLKVKIAGKTLFKSRDWLRPANEQDMPTT